MKTTLDLPENLVREMKMKAAREGRKLREVAAEVVQRGLLGSSANQVSKENRVLFPLVECQSANPDEELSPSRVAEILTDQETKWSEEAS